MIIKTNWTALDFPTAIEMERIRSNIKLLKDSYVAYKEIPSNLDYMTIEKANDIERIIHELDYILMWMKNNYIYSGVANCGQPRVWQQRFRRMYTYFVPQTWAELNYEYWNEIENLTFESKGVGYKSRDTEL